MRRLLTSYILSLVLVSGMIAQTSTHEVRSSIESDVEFYATNYGMFGRNIDSSRGGFIAPRGSGMAYIFGSGLWFAAKKNVYGTPRKLVFVAYNPNSSVSWATPGEGWAPGVPDTLKVGVPSLYYSHDYDMTTGEYTHPTVPPMGPSNWLLWLRPGQRVEPLFSGEYVYMNTQRTVGDNYAAPAFMPGVDEQFVSRFHDQNLNNYEITVDNARMMGFPIGVQIQQNIYGWKAGRFRDVVILQYDIINMSGDTLFGCSAAQATDPDLGIPDNDHIGSYSQRPDLRSTYVWTEMEDKPYGALATVLLEGPVTDNLGFIDNNRRREYRVNGRIGASPIWTTRDNPKTTEDRYDFMTSGSIESDPIVSDYRTLMATTTFNMRPGDTAHYTVAYAVLNGPPNVPLRVENSSDFISALPAGGIEIENLVEALNDDYYNSAHFTAMLPVPFGSCLSAVNALPNPAAGRQVTLIYALAERANVSLSLVNDMGQQLFIQELGAQEAGNHSERIDVTALPAGVYIVEVRTDAEVQRTKLAVTR